MPSLLELVARRQDLLERLSRGAVQKRTLVADLPDSRSTVDRAVRELAAAGLVHRTTDGYEATLAGRLAAAAHRDLRASLTDLTAARRLLEPLDGDVALDPCLFAGGEVHVGDGPTPYGSVTRIRDFFTGADRIWVLSRALTDPGLIRRVRDLVVDGGATLTAVVAEALLDQLREHEPDLLCELAAADRVDVSVTDRPPYSLVIGERAGERRVLLAVYDGESLHGVAVNDTPGAVRWALARFRDARAAATEVTDRASATGTETDLLAREGVVELTASYFERREPTPPATAWRTGFDLAAVRAGDALDREHVRDGERRSLSADLVERLREGRDHVLLGPPGVGKSTICRTVACRWFDAGHGPVFYRTSGRDRRFASRTLLAERLRGADGHALVVVEDAVREEANAVVGLLATFAADPTVTFLFDARRPEWDDPPTTFDADTESYRQEAVAQVAAPPLDERECARFVEQFEATVGHAVGTPPAELLDAVRSGEGDAAEPAELLLLLHRLALHADPLAEYDGTGPTTLVDEVAATADALDGLALEVGVLVNLLNAAGVGVRPAYVHAVAPDDPDGVRAALDRLTGRVIFGTAPDGRHRAVHGAWSAQFLDHLCDADAAERVARVVGRVLALASDPDRRERVAAAVGESAALDRAAETPGSWATALVEDLFALGRDRPGLAPLFGALDGAAFPPACEDALALRYRTWRGETALDGGYYDAAERDFEWLRSALDERAGAPNATLLARARRGLGKLARRRGNLDAAERHHEASLRVYREADDVAGEASCLINLGAVAWARGDLDAAASHFEAALPLKRSVGDRRGVANARNNLGIVAAARDDPSTAETHHEAALATRHEIGDRRGQADSLTNLGVVARDRGDLDAAERYARRGLERWREVGDRHGEANSLYQLGELALDRDDPGTAADYLVESRDLRAEIGDDQGWADSVRLLGAVALARGDHGTAAERARESLATYRDVTDRRGTAQSRALLGRVARARGDHEAARDHLTDAVECHRAAGATRDALDALETLVDVCVAAGDHEAARDYLSTGVDLAQAEGLDARCETLAARRAELA